MIKFVEDEMLEMVTLRKKRSGLPVNLYLDDSSSYKKSGHWKRIKLQADKGDSPNTRNMMPMSIDNNPQLLTKAESSLSTKEIDEVKAFVKLNKELLDQLADGIIDIGEFLEKMKKA